VASIHALAPGWPPALADLRKPACRKTIANKHGFVSGAVNAAARAGVLASNRCQALNGIGAQRVSRVLVTRRIRFRRSPGLTAGCAA